MSDHMTPQPEDLTGIAIIGMAGRFPGARDVEGLWANLVNGVDSISRLEEKDLERSLSSPETLALGRRYIRARGLLDKAEWFDAAFFGVMPREADVMDPQHRVFLECAWEAIENAGYDPHKYPGLIGVYAGASFNTYLINNLIANRAFAANLSGHYQTGEWPVVLGNDEDYLATRVAYKLNLRGPAITIQTACSTSLVAISQACLSLLGYQCDMALAGGVSITFPQKRDYLFEDDGLASADGSCRTFDASAQGTVFGHGAGVVVLKRLEDAVSDGDHIVAVIKGFGVNNDGGRKAGYTAPSVDGQSDVILMAHALAGFSPETIGYIEAHGTATPLGDPIEVEALTQAFRASTDAKGFCGIGSLKPNIGHLEAAAGVSGLIKAALALKHQQIPPTIHFKKPNPKIDFAQSPFYVVDKLTPWPTGPEPRRAGVTSLGIGGTNAHVVMQEAPVVSENESPRGDQLLVWSARSEAALQAMTDNLAAWLERNPHQNLADVAFTLHKGRREFSHRGALVARDAALASVALRSTDTKAVSRSSGSQQDRQIAFLFPGQGSQYVGMGSQLYEQEPRFREEVDRCADLLRPHLGFDIRTILFPTPAGRAEAEQRINETSVTQPAIFVIEYALARLWMSWGITPSILIGHSVGEYVAAVLAETFTLEDALKILAARANMMQALPGGSMLAVRLGAADIEPLLPAGASIAAHNSPKICTVSGPTDVLTRFQQDLQARKIESKLLSTSHAFHSSMMDPIMEPFTRLVAGVPRGEPKIRWVSTLTGRWMTADDMSDPAYWARQLRQSVRFSDALEAVAVERETVLLEVGPGHALSQLARQHPARSPETMVLSSFDPPGGESSDRESVLRTLGRLWVAGSKPDWDAFYAGERRRRVPLPTYPFERRRFWVEPAALTAEPASVLAAGAESIASPRMESPVPTAPVQEEASKKTRTSRDRVVEQLHALVSDIAGVTVPDETASFMELGLDSLFLVQASREIHERFGVRTTLRLLTDELSSLARLADFIDKERPAEVAAPQAAPAAVVDVATHEPVVLPLSEEQKEIWTASLMGDDASRAYNDVRVVRFSGALNQDWLRECLQVLIDRHDSLRTVVATTDPEQTILPTRTLDMRVDDLSALAAGEGQRRVREEGDRLGGATFDLVHGPLFRVHLFRLSERESVLLIAYHHIVVDGWSSAVLVRELARLYSARSENVTPSLGPALQYRDYIALQNEPAKVRQRTHAKDYWLERFADRPAAVEFPADRPRRTKSYRAGRASMLLDTASHRRIHDAASGLESTLFTLWFAVYSAWVHRITGREDVIIGSPFAGQLDASLSDRAGSRELVGHCVNFLPIRVHCSAETTFREHLRRVRESVLGAHEHHDYTFGELVTQLDFARDASRALLVSSIFNLLPSGGDDLLAIPGMDMRASFHPTGFGPFDLHTMLEAHEDGLHIDCDYNTALFDESTVLRWMEQWRFVAEQVLAQPEMTLGDLSVLPEQERQRVVVEWNETGREYPRDACLHELFEARAAETPDAIAVVFERQVLTYRELNARADELAAYLRAIGIGPDVLVGLCVQRSLETVVGVLAILKAGGAYVPLDPTFPRDRIAFMLEDSRAPVLLTQRSLVNDLPPTAARQVVIDEPLPRIEGSRGESVSAGPSSLAYVIYTSGSTGKPKGVQIEHRAVVNFLNAMRREPGLRPEDVLLAVTTLSFDIAGLELFLPLTTGARVVVVPWETAVDGKALLNALNEHRVTVLQATPATWRLLLAAEWRGTPGLKALCGGEPLPADLARELMARCGELWNMYGPTETTIWSSCCRVTDPADITIGRPIDNTELFIVDQQLRPLPIGVAGELLIGGDGVARGYLGRHELTAERFVRHPFMPGGRVYRTGDLCRYRADGRIDCLGRLDFQVKIRGFRIELGEIEAALMQHEAMANTVVVATQNAAGDDVLVAYCAPRPSTTIDAAVLRRHLAQKLPEYMIPAGFVFLERLPTTPNGKIDRRALPKEEFGSTPGETYEPPATPTEAALCEIVSAVLGVTPVGIHDDFFRLGGRSLEAVRAVSRIQQAMGLDVAVARLFEFPTVAGLARHLVDVRAAEIGDAELSAILDDIESGPGGVGGRVDGVRRTDDK
jgi:amino acid adenylation domain-containing protein